MWNNPYGHHMCLPRHNNIVISKNPYNIINDTREDIRLLVYIRKYISYGGFEYHKLGPIEEYARYDLNPRDRISVKLPSDVGYVELRVVGVRDGERGYYRNAYLNNPSDLRPVNDILISTIIGANDFTRYKV